MVGSGPHNRRVGTDFFFGRETVFAGSRSQRPHQTTDGTGADHGTPDCPFCPGNERLLADITWQLDQGDRWQTRAVPNLYPIVAPPTGYHEIIIDAPQHRLPAPEMTGEFWRGLMTTYSARYHACAADWPFVTLYRNVGRTAGASIEHPHSQLVAMARAPAAVQSMRNRLQRSLRKTGLCLLCDQLQRVTLDGGRMIAETSSYVVFVPEIPEVPFEAWIVPRMHSSVFVRNENETGALADSLHDLFHRMNSVLGAFDHNMMLQCDGPTERPYLHWFIRVRPKLEMGGGFELATGMSVNASRPEADAEALRLAKLSPQP